MEKFTITITDNETGDILVQSETNAIIAGISSDDESGMPLAAVNATPMMIGNAILAARDSIGTILKDCPDSKEYITLYDAMRNKCKEELQ